MFECLKRVVSVQCIRRRRIICSLNVSLVGLFGLREVVGVDFIDGWKQICLKVKDVVENEDILQSIVFGL